nr:hypothetical protein [Tanacetum cinerariifolium]
VYDPNPNSFDCPPDSCHPPHPTYETYSGNSCGNDSHLGYDCPPQFLLLAWDRVFKINDAFGNKQHKPEDIQELFRKLLNDLQNINEGLAGCINTPGWNHPAFYNNGDDDDMDYTIAITPILSIEEPDNSLSMGDEHLDTILATESDEVIKSSVEDLVPIPSESEGYECSFHESLGVQKKAEKFQGPDEIRDQEISLDLKQG